MSGVRVGLVGAGMAGLSCATELRKGGVDVVLFDKGRGPGGRMATRRTEVAGDMLHFDHGAQYFTARDSAFVATVGKWLVRGVVAGWPAAGDEAYVGVPGMNGPLKHMAKDLDVHWGVRIEQIRQQERGGWTLTSADERHECDIVICAMPAEQAAELLGQAAPDFAAKALQSRSKPCWAAMAAFESPLPIDTDAIRSREGKIAWAARNSSKPQRGAGETWVIHASPEFSREILELPKEAAADVLLEAFFDQAGVAPVAPMHSAAHRWLYAMAESGPGPASLWNAETKVGACGDWLTEPRVEGAWLSGRSMAEQILDSLNDGARFI